MITKKTIYTGATTETAETRVNNVNNTITVNVDTENIVNKGKLQSVEDHLTQNDLKIAQQTTIDLASFRSSVGQEIRAGIIDLFEHYNDNINKNLKVLTAADILPEATQETFEGSHIYRKLNDSLFYISGGSAKGGRSENTGLTLTPPATTTSEFRIPLFSEQVGNKLYFFYMSDSGTFDVMQSYDLETQQYNPQVAIDLGIQLRGYESTYVLSSVHCAIGDWIYLFTAPTEPFEIYNEEGFYYQRVNVNTYKVETGYINVPNYEDFKTFGLTVCAVSNNTGSYIVALGSTNEIIEGDDGSLADALVNASYYVYKIESKDSSLSANLLLQIPGIKTMAGSAFAQYDLVGNSLIVSPGMDVLTAHPDTPLEEALIRHFCIIDLENKTFRNTPDLDTDLISQFMTIGGAHAAIDNDIYYIAGLPLISMLGGGMSDPFDRSFVHNLYKFNLDSLELSQITSEYPGIITAGGINTVYGVYDSKIHFIGYDIEDLHYLESQPELLFAPDYYTLCVYTPPFEQYKVTKIYDDQNLKVRSVDNQEILGTGNIETVPIIKNTDIAYNSSTFNHSKFMRHSDDKLKVVGKTQLPEIKLTDHHSMGITAPFTIAATQTQVEYNNEFYLICAQSQNTAQSSTITQYLMKYNKETTQLQPLLKLGEIRQTASQSIIGELYESFTIIGSTIYIYGKFNTNMHSNGSSGSNTTTLEPKFWTIDLKAPQLEIKDTGLALSRFIDQPQLYYSEVYGLLVLGGELYQSNDLTTSSVTNNYCIAVNPNSYTINNEYQYDIELNYGEFLNFVTYTKDPNKYLVSTNKGRFFEIYHTSEATICNLLNINYYNTSTIDTKAITRFHNKIYYFGCDSAYESDARAIHMLDLDQTSLTFTRLKWPEGNYIQLPIEAHNALFCTADEEQIYLFFANTKNQAEINSDYNCLIYSNFEYAPKYIHLEDEQGLEKLSDSKIYFEDIQEINSIILKPSNNSLIAKIDWGDGTVDIGNNIRFEQSFSHTYQKKGNYVVTITDKFIPGFPVNAQEAFHAKKLILSPVFTEVTKEIIGGMRLTELELPDTITSIGPEAFSQALLTHIDVPKNCIEILNRAFAGMPNLKSLYFPKSLKSIGNNIVDGSTKFDTLYLEDLNAYCACAIDPHIWTEILDTASSRWSNLYYSPKYIYIKKDLAQPLQEVTLARGLTIDAPLFGSCDSIKNILNNGAIIKTKLTLVDLPDLSYAEGTLESLKFLKEAKMFKITDQCTALPENMLKDTLVESLVIPASINRAAQIAETAFNSNYLKRIYYEGDAKTLHNQLYPAIPTTYVVTYSAYFYGVRPYGAELWKCKQNPDISLHKAIPQPEYFVPNIDSGYVYSQYSSKLLDNFVMKANVILPDDIPVEIRNQYIESISGGFFAHRHTLKTVTFNGNIVRPDFAYRNDLPLYMFSECSQLETVILNKTKVEIDACCFNNCVKLHNILGSDKITAIANYAFNGCKSLDNIVFNNLTFLGTYAFANCSSLTQITFNNIESLTNLPFGENLDHNLVIHYQGDTVPAIEDTFINEQDKNKVKLIIAKRSTYDNFMKDPKWAAYSDIMDCYVMHSEFDLETLKIATEAVTGAFKMSRDFDMSADGVLTIYKPIEIKSFTNNIKEALKGSKISEVTFNWSLSKKPTGLKLNGTSLPLEDSGNVLDGEATLDTLSITSDTNIEFEASDNKHTDIQTTSIKFYNELIYGAASNFDEGNVPGKFTHQLMSKFINVNVTAGAGQYIYYAFPVSFGTPTFKAGGFEGGFVLEGTRSITNSAGFPEDYYIYKSEETNLGNTTVEVFN